MILVLIAVACGNPFGSDLPANTTFTIPTDSEWQIPPGFDVAIPPTRNKVDPMESKYLGGPPDTPDFTMARKSDTDKGLESIFIVVWADGLSANSDPREVLMSWTQDDGIRHAEYDAVVVTDRIGLQSASWRGQAQSLGQESPQGIIAAVISHPETQRVWRLSCFVTSEEVSEEVARICDQVQAEFRPL